MRGLHENWINNINEAIVRKWAEHIIELKQMNLSEYRIVGDYFRYDENLRYKLKSLRKRIIIGLELPDIGQENYLIWGTPGSGKSFLPRQLAALLGRSVCYLDLNMNEPDRKKKRESFKLAFDTLKKADAKPVLCFIDEIDSVPTVESGNSKLASDQEELYSYKNLLLLLEPKHQRNFRACFILAGSTGSNMEEMKNLMATYDRKGADLIDRIPPENRYIIPSMSIEDRIIVVLSNLMTAARSRGLKVREVDKLALLFIALDPELTSARNIAQKAINSVKRLELEDQVKYEYFFPDGDEKTMHAFYAKWNNECLHSHFVRVVDDQDHEESQVPILGKFASIEKKIERASAQERATLKVESKDLGKVPNQPFMENQVTGKFAKERTWGVVKSELDFSMLEPLDLTGPGKIYLIKGKPGMGKSTYLLWSLEESSQKPSWPFDRIVFLHPQYYDLWAEELSDCDPERTLLVIDALKRGTDTDSRFIDRCMELQTIALEGKKVHESLIGPFKILATIRDEEYHDLMKQKAFEWMSHEVFDITPEKLVPERILKKLLMSYGVPYEIPANREKEVMEKLAAKSEGSPFYIRHMVQELSGRNLSFSEGALEEYPAGMVKLIWHILTRNYYVKDDDVIAFLLLTLLKTDRPLSDHFFDFVVERVMQTQKKEVEEKVASLRSSYLQGFSTEIGQRTCNSYTLSSHWKQSLETGLKHPDVVTDLYRDTVFSYKKIEDLHFTSLTEETVRQLETHLGQGFKEVADAFLCVDLARIGSDCLEHATRLYTGLCSSSKLHKDHMEYVQGELFELWIGKAWEYRALYDDHKVVTCYENAFERLGVRGDYEQLHAYAYFLRKRILPAFKYGTPEFQRCKEKIEGIFKEVIANQSEQDAKLMSYQSLASFYAELGEEENAELAFKATFEADPTYIPARHAYARFLRDRGKKEWAKDHKKAIECLLGSEDQFKKTLGIFEDVKARLPKKEMELNEAWLTNSYANFLIDKTKFLVGKTDSETEYDYRLRMDKEIDELFERNLTKYPHHGQSVVAYSFFLMSYAKILPEYRGGENLKKCERLLKDFVEFERGKKEKTLPYFIALQILASSLRVLMTSFFGQSFDWKESERLLKESSRSFDSHHNSRAYHSLGRLYVHWASILRRKDDMKGYNEKMSLAKEAYQKAMEIVPENHMSANHLSRVYLSYAFFLGYIGEKQKSVDYVNKALELVQKFAYLPFASYYALTNLGTDLLQDRETELARVVSTQAWKIAEKLGINPSYSVFMLGEICREEQKTSEALEYYLLSARLGNTSDVWGSTRNSIRQLMNDLRIRKSKSPTVYSDCVRKCLECSKEAWQLDQNSWKSCGDYGEDLLETDEFEEAIRILETGISLVQQSSELGEADKRKRLSWFYEKIGFCYKDQEKTMKAEEYLLRAAETEDSALGYFRAAGWMFELHCFETTLMVSRKFVEKIASCEEKEKILPNMAYHLKRMALSYENLSKEHEAASLWKDYAAVCFYSSPQDGAHECGKAGNRLMKLNQFPEARECFLRSNRLDPSNAQNLSQLGYTNKMLQRWEECAMCSRKAFETRGRIEDRVLSEFCQRQRGMDTRVADSNSVENMMDKAILCEILGEYGDALEYYSRILSILERQNYGDKAELSIRRFVADAVWILGRKDETLKLYEEIRDEVADYEKMIVETIIWLIRKALDRQTDFDLKERILSLLKAGPLKGNNEKALGVEIGKRFGVNPLTIEKLLDSLHAERLVKRTDLSEYSPITDSTRASVILSLEKHGQETQAKKTKPNPS